MTETAGCLRIVVVWEGEAPAEPGDRNRHSVRFAGRLALPKTLPKLSRNLKRVAPAFVPEHERYQRSLKPAGTPAALRDTGCTQGQRLHAFQIMPSQHPRSNRRYKKRTAPKAILVKRLDSEMRAEHLLRDDVHAPPTELHDSVG